jgi:hypothetical protein
MKKSDQRNQLKNHKAKRVRRKNDHARSTAR